MEDILLRDTTAEVIQGNKQLLNEFDMTDLHVHTVYSLSRVFGVKYIESTIEIRDLLKKAKSLGYSTLVITDHDIPRRENNRIGNYFPFKGALKAKETGKDYGINVIAGQEIKYIGSDLEKGDILVFPLDEEIPHKYKTGTLESLIDYCNDNSILKCIPHPLARDKLKWGSSTLSYSPETKSFREELNMFDAVSTLHAFSYKEINRIADYLAKDFDIAKFGESDSHVLENFGRAGTLIPKGMDLMDAIQKRKTVPFGISLNKELAVTRGRSATLNTLRYVQQMREKGSYGGDGLEVFKQLYGDTGEIVRELAVHGIFAFVNSVGKVIESYLYNKSKLSAKHFYKQFFEGV